MRKERSGIAQRVLFMALLLGVPVALPGASPAQEPANSFGLTPPCPLRDSQGVAPAVGVQKSFQEVYTLYKDRVVFISTEQTIRIPPNPLFNDPLFRQFFGDRPEAQPSTKKVIGMGSGFIISEDGYIVTNQHVVGGAEKVKVKINEAEYDAQVIAIDKLTDIALLKVATTEKLQPVFFGDSDTVKVGDWAIAIGNPFGLEKTFTVGVISATGRKDLDPGVGVLTHIQTDASINPGNSGGALINIYGEVIGINRMIYSESGGSLGIGFAIPINIAKSIIEQLKLHRKVIRGYIGVQIAPLTPAQAKALGLETTEGAIVAAVMKGGPAHKAGIIPGDVVLKVGDTKIVGYADLVTAVEKTPIGTMIRFEIWRNKALVTIDVTVAERP